MIKIAALNVFSAINAESMHTCTIGIAVFTIIAWLLFTVLSLATKDGIEGGTCIDIL